MASKASSSNSSICRGAHCRHFSDRISRLSDEVLCHILSFLLTEEAVRTVILSKRWRYVSTSVPTIDITDMPYNRLYDANKFIDFVDSVFRLNDAPCLKRFRLFCNRDYDSSRVSDWISYVALRRVEKIELLWFYLNKPLRLPLSIFTCNKIVSLKIWHTILVNVPKLVNFPCLKTIKLVSVKVVDSDAMKNLLAGCPALEDLYVDVAIRSLDDQVYTLHVRSSSLKTLEVITDAFPSDHNEEIFIDAPNLQHLTLKDFVTLQINMNYLSSLITANIGLERDSARVGRNTHNRVTDLLRKISNTEYLCLSLDTMECLEHEVLDNFPVFHNLNHLVVENYGHYSWRGLSTLLECSPNLITLVLGMSCISHERHPQLCPPKCWMLYLEKIELRRFEGTRTEMELVRHLLVNATVLKKMSIQYYSSWCKDEEELQIVKKLLMFPRGSTTCQIEFIPYL